MPDGFTTIPAGKLGDDSGYLVKSGFRISFVVHAIVIEGDYGFGQYSAKTQARNAETGEVVQKVSRDFFVFRKVQNDWKIFWYMFNNVKAINN